MYKASYYPEGTTQSLDVFWKIEHKQLCVIQNDKTWFFEREDVSAPSRLSSLPREISISGLGQLVCEANQEINAWLDDDKPDTFIKMESNKRWVFTSVFLVPVCLFCMFKFVIPWFAIGMAATMPDAINRIVSEQTMLALDYTLLDASELEAEKQQSILREFEHLIDELTIEHSSFQILFRNSESVGPNAFALPDGTIVFTDQFVELVEEEQALLNAVLLHEIAHVEKHHSMQLVAESFLTTMVISYFFGDASGAIEAFLGVGSTVLQNQFSQAAEWEADEFALEQLEKTGRSRQDFAQAMEKLASIMPESHKSDSWFSTHPMMVERIQNAKQSK